MNAANSNKRKSALEAEISSWATSRLEILFEILSGTFGAISLHNISVALSYTFWAVKWGLEL